MVAKDFKLTLKDVDVRNRIIEGYFASFETIDSDGDVFVNGAFAKSIKENGPAGKGRIKHLFNHWDAVGVLTVLDEDNKGLHYISKIGTHTKGEDVLRMANDGIITEHSVGIELIPDKADIANGIRYLREVKLWEGSSLDKWGANENTPLLKSMGKEQALLHVAERIYEINKALTGRTSYSDDTYYELIVKLSTLERMLKSLTEEQPPVTGTEPHVKPTGQKRGVDIETLIKLIKENK